MPNSHLDAETLVNQLASDLRQYITDKQLDDPALVGIHTGGVWVAERLHSLLNFSQPLGQLDINFYRDDFSEKGLHPTVKPSTLNFDVDDQHIILVDDVLYTGRTIRAAMNELFDYGRPAGIHLVALVERTGRELPIHADVCGHSLNLSPTQHIKLTGPNPLALDIMEA